MTDSTPTPELTEEQRAKVARFGFDRPERRIGQHIADLEARADGIAMVADCLEDLVADQRREELRIRRQAEACRALLAKDAAALPEEGENRGHRRSDNPASR